MTRNVKAKLNVFRRSERRAEPYTYPSFRILVNEEDFHVTNNTPEWPSGCLITRFWGRLSYDEPYLFQMLNRPTIGGGETFTAPRCLMSGGKHWLLPDFAYRTERQLCAQCRGKLVRMLATQDTSWKFWLKDGSVWQHRRRVCAVQAGATVR
jgi:hypothetical protein